MGMSGKPPMKVGSLDMCETFKKRNFSQKV